MSTPIVPPRPTARQAPPTEIELPQQPQIPPRPMAKRGVSPGGRNYQQSPFHEKYDPLSLTRTRSNEPLRKLPSVSAMPGLGAEGFEYGEIQYQQAEPSSALAADAAAQTRNISENLKLHAPKPSLPTTSATAQVQAVTRTDSAAAVAHGIGRPPSEQDGEPLVLTRSRASFSRPDSAMSNERRRSAFEEGPADHGGFRVPINPLLGDVQAPSPAPGLSPHHTGSHEGKHRRHHRTSSGREVFLPPGSYGLHGHGMQPAGNLEKDWYAKHPQELEHEEVAGHGVYEAIGSGRGAFALSSDDLNKIVRNTASRGSGFGTTGNVPSYPDEQIGYIASEHYSSKRDPTGLQKSSSDTPASPLRKASFPSSDVPTSDLHRGSQDAGTANEPEGVHIDAPTQKYNKVTGGEETMREKGDVKPYVEHPTVDDDGMVNEHGYTVPILAGDELAKEVGHENLQPAISPSPRRSSDYDAFRTGASPHGSRPSSRPGSIHGMHSAMHHNLQRYVSHHEEREHVHTPLEDVDEYEPLFPEDDGKKAVSTTDRFKQRPDALRQRFPSQDIWEDTPDSAMYEATVSTPDLTTDSKTSAFELPEVEQARKGEATEVEKAKLIPAEERLRQSKFAPHLRDDMPTRPGVQPRFPSSDIWEDSPDSHHLVATVNSPEPDIESPTSPTEPQRPEGSRLGPGASTQQIEPSVVPSIPPRPQKKSDTGAQTELKKVPSIPDRPKPQVPARPAKKDAEGLSQVTSNTSQESTEPVTSPPIPKAKPQVPARPSSKIASMRSNFMNDLNQKLGLGPPKEKEPEPEPEPEEAKPLEDARKSRARGPQRRAPPKSANAPSRPSPLQFSLLAPQSMWSIDDSGSLNVSKEVSKPKLSEEKQAQLENSTPADAPMAPTVDTTSKAQIEADKRADDAPPPMASALSTNTAGESTDPTPHGDDEPLAKQTSTTSTSSKGLAKADSNEENIVSQQTTASDSSAKTLERVESIDPTEHAEPSSATTAAATSKE